MIVSPLFGSQVEDLKKFAESKDWFQADALRKLALLKEQT